MYFSLLSSLTALALAGLGQATSFGQAKPDTTVPLPTTDSWYVPPNNVASFAPGDVIKDRAVSNNLNGYFSNGKPVSVSSSHQVMYRTTDSLGKPVAGVMTLLVPNNADPTKLWSHQTAYDSNNLNCAPSYALRSGANTTSETDIIYIAAALNNGYYVSTADFHGLYGQFGAGIQAGQATLDSVRATLRYGPKYGLANPKIGLWGYSGGSIGAEWAVELQPQYAPELKFVGAAPGGLIPNFVNALNLLNKGISAGLGFASLQGLSNAYPDLKKLLESSFIPWKRAEFLQIGSGCLNDVTSAGAFKDVFSYFYQGQFIANDPAWQNALRNGGLAGQHGTPTMPLFILEAIGDEISPIADADALVKTLCQKGATVQYHRDSFGEHISEALTEGPTAFQWLADRLDGKPLGYSGCVTKNTFVNTFSPTQYPAVANLYVSALQTLFYGGNLGQKLGISG